MAEPVAALFAPTLGTVEVTATPSGGGGVTVRGLWDKGELEYNGGDDYGSRHRRENIHFTFNYADCPTLNEGGSIDYNGYACPVLDVVTDGFTTTAILGAGVLLAELLTADGAGLLLTASGAGTLLIP
jgi:hypothetical protein